MMHLAHILFEPVILKENFLSKLDTRIKVIWVAAALALNLILPGNTFQVFLLIFYLAVALSWKVKFKYIFGRLALPILIGIFLILTRLSGIHLALVILAGVSCISLVSFSSSFEALLGVLAKFKFPPILIEITYLMYKYIFIFFEEIDTIYHAQAARLGYINFRNSLRSLGILAGILIIRSFERATLCYEAIMARGYKDRLFY